MCKERLWKRASFSAGASLGDQGGDPALPGIFRERWDFDLLRGLVNWEIREICKKGSAKGQLSPQGSRWGT